MIRGIVTICAALLLAPLLLACQGGQLLPGESDTAPDKPGKTTVTISRTKKATKFKDVDTGETFGASISRTRKAATFKDLSPDANQRDGDGLKKPGADQSGELGGGSETGPRKADKGEERRGGRAASLISGQEGIRDKLGRSGRRGPGKSLG